MAPAVAVRGAHVYNILTGFEGDRVDDPGSVFCGKHMRNGWKNEGLPWGYDYPDLMWVTREQETAPVTG